LVGLVGTGKTTIAYSIAQLWDGRLNVSFWRYGWFSAFKRAVKGIPDAEPVDSKALRRVIQKIR